MAEYTVKSDSGELRVEIPGTVDEKTRQMILGTVKSCMEKDYEKQALRELNQLLIRVQTLLDHLRKDKKLTKELERSIWEMVAVYLRRGIELGKLCEDKPDRIFDIIQLNHFFAQDALKKLPKDKKPTAEYIFHSFLMGKQCYETGLTLSAFLSMDKQKELLKRVERESGAYIW